MDKIHSILFVCTGNSCRSVMAEALLKKYLNDLGRNDIEVWSAGTRTVDGLSPTHETIEILKEEGVDVSGYRSKDLTNEMIRKAGLILVMEWIHKDEVLNRVPEAAPKVHLLKEFVSPDNALHPYRMGVGDPIGRPMEDYKHCLVIIKKAVEKIARML